MELFKRKATYRLYPNATELAALECTHGLHCRATNALLEEHKRRYESGESSYSFAAMCKDLTSWRERSDALGSLNAQSLQVTAKRASLAFAAFFRRAAAGQTAGYPRFKSAKRFAGWGYKTLGDGWRLLQEHSVAKHGKYAGTEYGAVRLSGIGTVSMRGRARFPGTPKTAEVIRRKDKWYLSVTFEVSRADLQCKQVRTAGSASMSFDWGINTLLKQIVGDALTGEVVSVDNPRWLKTKLSRIKDLQQAISQREEAAKAASGKTKRFPVNARLAGLYDRLRRIHGQIARQRQDFYHKLTTALVQRFGLIVTEQLTVKNMVRAPKAKKADDGTYLPNGAAAKAGLNRSILDGAPATMMQQYRYKAAEVGSILMELPTKMLKPSQRCCKCGQTQKMTLAERTYQCSCGSVMDRDENAARTMLRYAFESAWWENAKQAGTVCAAAALRAA